MKNKFLVIIEEGKNNFSAYSPDLPGCVAVGETLEETLELMRDAIVFHLEGLLRNEMEIPKPHTRAEYIAVPAFA